MLLEMETLRLIWWLLLGILFIGFAITDGFDLGIAVLLPLVARDDIERRIVLNTIGPFWEGNQVWIILGAGAIFAAWPFVYSVTFYSFYLLILLLLFTLGISRPVSFKYRSKLPNYFWRRFWDWIVFIGGLFPALIFGLLVGNVLTGLPFYFDDDLRIFYTGTFLNLFHPFAVWCALISLAMLVMQGGLYLAIKTHDPIRSRAIYWSRMASVVVMLFFILAGFWVADVLPGYLITSTIDPNGYSNPTHKTVITQVGAWMQNYSRYPWSMTAPLLGIFGALLVGITARLGNSRFAFVCSSFSLFGIIATVGISMFPFILPSSTQASSSLVVWDASSSQLTLLMMLFAAVFFMPLILLYTSWVYYALRGKVSKEIIEKDDKHTAY